MEIETGNIRFLPKPSQSPIQISVDDIPCPDHFRPSIRKAISLKDDEARCHTVAWETIRDDVIAICNETLAKIHMGAGDTDIFFKTNMTKLWFSVTGELKPSTPFIKTATSFLLVTDPIKRKRT